MTRGQQTVALPDGRHLAYEDVGNRHGLPVLYCHGMPGCRLERRVFMSDELLKILGLRVITPDRPGCGGSDFKAKRRIEDWPRDVAVLIEHLRLERFVVLGFSTGTPYALALAASELPVAAVAIVSGNAPPGSVPDVRPGLPATASRWPGFTRALLEIIRVMARWAPEFTLHRAIEMLSQADRDAVASPRMRREFLAMLRETLRQGPRGLLVDLQLMQQNWDVLRPSSSIPVHIWHGGADVDSPVSIARYLAQSLSPATLRCFPTEGHVSLFVHHPEEILRSLGATADGAATAGGE
jgi:pimeloyl-ACP methyl ester carboxylesterase